MANGDALDGLLARAAAGERPALIDLLNHCRDGMVARLRARVLANEAEDIVQDALVQAIQRLDQFAWQGWEALQARLWAFVENAHADRRKYHVRECRHERRWLRTCHPRELTARSASIREFLVQRQQSCV